MSEQFKYRVFCTTEQKYVDFWSYDEAPTTCPNNYKHTIDSNQIYKLDERYVGRKNVVYIQEEETATQGNYRFECVNYNIGSNAEEVHDFQFPYPVNMLEVKIRSKEDHRGDVVNCQVVPSVPIGYITSNLSVGSSNVYVSNTVLQYMKVGYHMALQRPGSSNMEDLEEALVKVDENNMITTQNASTSNYPPGTYVRMHVGIIKNLLLDEPDWYTIGDRKIGASYLPGKTTLRMIYSNNNQQPKQVTLYLQYLY